MSQTRSLIFFAILGIAGIVTFFNLFSRYSPLASFDLALTRAEIIECALVELEHIGFDARQYESEAVFNYQSEVALYLQMREGVVVANQILRADTLFSHNWYVYLYDKALTPSQMREQYRLWLTPTGKLMGFRRELQDTVAMPSLSEAEARALAEGFLRERGVDLERYTLERSQTDQFSKRKDHFFSWIRADSIFGMGAKVWTRVQGNKIGGFRHDLDMPEAFQQAGSAIEPIVRFIITGSAIATFFLLLFIIPLFLKKYLEGEVGIRTALMITLPLFGITVIEHLLKFPRIGYGITMGDVNWATTRFIVFVFTVLIVHAFLAIMVMGAWSTGESSARRGWSGKLLAIDGILHRKFFTLDLAKAIIRGYGLGFAILAVLFGIWALVSSSTQVGAFVASLGGIPESYAPALSAVLLATRVAVMTEIVFRLFFVTWLREKTHKHWPGVITSAVVWTAVAFTLWDFPLAFIDFGWLFAAYFLIGIVQAVILIRYNLMTAMTANFVMLACTYATPILISTAPYFQQQSWLFFGMMGLPLVVAAGGLILRQKFQFSFELTPAHIRRISERERMSKELEIARSVQMSLLPRENPRIEGYDIAGICVPALEVGGDYYDFFNVGNEKFGIAIGDVSGKGVPAAIYMTLTKGILQSHACESESPREVLSKLNRQIYRNIERNSFVSMFYAVLDMKQHRMQFARAGHNPAILAHRASFTHELLQPSGIALGLESGERFHQFLEERTLQLHSGDVLTFYTDGFTEASNGKAIEFGEERLLEIVSNSKNLSAAEIVQNVVRSVKAFVGHHPQHDDMTMVVIKAL